MSQVTYIKPSGTELTVNNTEETKKYARINGWTKKQKPKPKVNNDKPRQLDKLL